LALRRRVCGRVGCAPFPSLRWFTVVIVAGVGSLGGAVLAGFLFVMLDRFLPVHGTADIIIAAAALLLAYIPGGSLMGALDKLAGVARAPKGLMQTFASARGQPGP